MEAAELIGIAGSSLWRYETGQRVPSYDDLRDILETYRCSPSECEKAEAARREIVVQKKKQKAQT